MRLLPSTLIATLLLGPACTLGLAQHAGAHGYGNHSGGGKKSGSVKPYAASMSHQKNHSSLIPSAHSKPGLAEELTRIENQPLPGSSGPAPRQNTARSTPLPKLDFEKGDKRGKGVAIKASRHSSKGKSMTSTKSRRSSASAGMRIRAH